MPVPTPESPDVTDNELLMQFERHRDVHALSQLVGRHASLVMGVCRQVSLSEQDAEDAFQATFLILTRRSRRLLHVSSLGGWLHRVAFRTALRSSQRQVRRREVPLKSHPAENDSSDPLNEVHRREMQRVLHEELQRLPARYRDAIVLCDLEQKTRAEAACCLDCTESGIKAALARGRRQLRMQLLRRGVAMSIALATAQDALAKVPIPSAAVDQTVELCTADRLGTLPSPSSSLKSLTRQGNLAMRFSTISQAIAVLAVAAVLCTIPFLLAAQVAVDANTSTSTVVANPAQGAEADNASSSAVLNMDTQSSDNESSDSVANEVASAVATSFPEYALSGNGSIDASSFVLFYMAAKNTFLAYNKKTGVWSQHVFPEGLEVFPFVLGGGPIGSLGGQPLASVGFRLRGAPVSELVAVDMKGRFRVLQLTAPVNKPFKPLMHSSGVTYYVVDGTIYAFSGKTGTWDTLEAPHVRTSPDTGYLIGSALIEADQGTLIVEFENRVAAFSSESGKWSVADFSALNESSKENLEPRRAEP